MKLDRIFAATILVGLLLDRWTKALVEQRFQLFETLPLAPGLALTYVRNPGAAFSLLADADPVWKIPFFMGVLVVALYLCLKVLSQTPAEDRLSRAALGLIVSGAVGNAVDRIRLGEVTDFIHVDLGFWPFHPWPIFNVADSAVCVGAALVIWRSWRSAPAAVRPEA